MRIEKIGKRHYAFDLEWVDSPVEQKPEDTVADTLSGEPRKGTLYVHVTATNKESAVVGYGVPAAKVGGPIHSYAATLAQRGRNGVFVVPTGDQQLWFVVISSGVVVPGTDRSGAPADIMRAAAALKSSLGVDLYCASGVEGTEDNFDPASAVAHVRKPARLRSLSTYAKTAAAAALLLVFMGGLGFAAYRMVAPSRPIGQSQAQAEELAREAWLANASRATAGLAEDSGWADAALTTVFAKHPPFIAGWRAEGVSCTPAGCDLQYVLPPDAINAISPLREHFGAALSAASPDGHSLSVHFPATGKSRVFTLADLKIIGQAPAPVEDMLGLLPISVARAAVDKPPATAWLTGAPAGFPAMRIETVSIKSDQVNPAAIRMALAYWHAGGFVPVKMVWSNGWGSVPAAWRVEFMRVSAGT